jgi:hypothetical protein
MSGEAGSFLAALSFRRLSPICRSALEADAVASAAWWSREVVERSWAAAQFSLPIGVAQFHTDSLLERRFIQQTIIGVFTEFGEQPAMFAIPSAGRKYVMQHC